MRFNLFDKRPEDPRVAAVREMAKNFRDMGNSLEQDIKDNAKAGRHEMCDECAAGLLVTVLDASAKVAQLFGQQAKVPPEMVTKGMLANLAKQMAQGRQPQFHAAFVDEEVPPRSMMS